MTAVLDNLDDLERAAERLLLFVKLEQDITRVAVFLDQLEVLVDANEPHRRRERFGARIRERFL